MSKFDPSQLPDLTGKVVIVTGGHSGLLVSLFFVLDMLTLFRAVAWVQPPNFSATEPKYMLPLVQSTK